MAVVRKKTLTVCKGTMRNRPIADVVIEVSEKHCADLERIPKSQRHELYLGQGRELMTALIETVPSSTLEGMWQAMCERKMYVGDMPVH